MVILIEIEKLFAKTFVLGLASANGSKCRIDWGDGITGTYSLKELRTAYGLKLEKLKISSSERWTMNVADFQANANCIEMF